jgi:PAS domain S-box-containing protein
VRVNAVNLGDGRILGHVIDIEELVATRREAEAARRRFAALIEHSADVIAVLDSEGKLLEANPSGERLLGRDTAKDLGHNMLELVHPDDHAAATAALAETTAHEGLWKEHTFRLRNAEGSWVHLAVIGKNCLNDPAIGGIIINGRDVTERAQHLASLVGALIRATEFRDPYTAGHQGKVSRLAGHVARRMTLSPSEVSHIELGASLHDLGKISVPAEILTRPGRLTAPEFEIVKGHCQIGYDIVQDEHFPATITDIVLHHHERLDGSGYPHGLERNDLELGARVVAVADVVDAISSHRPYRAGLGIGVAVEEITRQRGRHYDPEVVDAMLAVLTEVDTTPDDADYPDSTDPT